jgi:outer membrane protein TolC
VDQKSARRHDQASRFVPGGLWVAACFGLLVTLAMGVGPASAETLQEALANAYLVNPVLNAERARLRATDEQVALAKSGLRPTVSASGDTAFQNVDNDVKRGAGSTAAGSCAIRRSCACARTTSPC